MTQLRYLIDNPEQVWDAKDRLERLQFLAEDPVQMHKTRFDAWVKAAAAHALEMADERDMDEDIAVDIIVKHLAEIHDQWRAEAKRRHHAP